MLMKIPRARLRSRLLALAFAASACVGASAGAAQEPGGRKGPERPSATVCGRVVYEGTDKPVRRARLMLVSYDQTGVERGTLTDARGEFRMADVPAGAYFAVLDVPGVVSPVAYMPLESARGGPLAYDAVREQFGEVVVEGKGEVEVTVRARRGGAITGRVTYADGEPAVNVDVHVMRRERRGLSKVLTGINIGALASLRTDDRGVYRIAGLPEGEYVVAASERAAHVDDTGVREDEMLARGAVESFMSPQLLTTFYPSATIAKEAATVKVDAGEEREGVDITVAERALRTVAGVVRGRHDKQPLAGARVAILARGESERTPGFPPFAEAARNSAATDAEGRWTLREIPDGDYTLVVTPPDKTERPVPMGDPAFAAAAAVRPKTLAPLRHDLSVSSDVDGLVVELGEGGRVSGDVVVEGLKELPERAYAYVYVRATPVGERGEARPGVGGAGASAGLPAGGPFVVEGLRPGRFVLRADVNGSAGDTGLYVKSVTWRGKDLRREPLGLGEGESVEGVTVVVTRGQATLNLSALDRERKPARYRNVLVAPPDPLAAANYGWQTLCTTDDAGACSVRVAPGEYALIPLLPGETAATFEELVRLRGAAAQRVVLLPGETKSFELTLR